MLKFYTVPVQNICHQFSHVVFIICIKQPLVFFDAEYIAFYLLNEWPLLHLKSASMCDGDLERREDRGLQNGVYHNSSTFRYVTFWHNLYQNKCKISGSTRVILLH